MSKDLETAIIKTPYQKMSYTEQQILEIAKCADPVTGPEKFTPVYERCSVLRGSYQGACKDGEHWAPKHKKDLFKALTKKEVGEE